MRRLTVLLLGAVIAGAQSIPTISSIGTSSSTNEVTVSYNPGVAGSYAITAASCSGGVTTFTIGSQIPAGSLITVSGAFDSGGPGNGYVAYNPSGIYVNSSTGTTLSVTYGCTGYTWTSGGVVSWIPSCQVRYGVASGVYLFSSVSINQAALPQKYPTGFSAVCSVVVNGLQDGTTYYFLPTSRPNADDETAICATSGCGAVEQVVTTPAAGISHLPAPPAAVASQVSSPIDVTGYQVVNLSNAGSMTGECYATGNVNWPSGYSNSNPMIHANDTLTTIFNNSEMAYGTVFYVPQGTLCVPIPTDGNMTGYTFPVLAVDPSATGPSIDAANHRWISFRSAPGGAADFPPFGVRTGPSFFNHYGGFKMNQPTPYGYSNNGGVFSNTSGQIHHIDIENLELTADGTVASAQSKPYPAFLRFGNNEGGGTPPFAKYIVVRSNWLHSPVRTNLNSGYPVVAGLLSTSSDGQMVIADNFVDNHYPRSAVPGNGNFGFYFMESTGGPFSIENNFMEGLAQMIYIETVNPLDAVPFDVTVNRNYLYWPRSDPNYPGVDTLALAQFLGYDATRQQIEFKGVTRAVISGNTINGSWAMANQGPAILLLCFGHVSDVAIRSNIITNSSSLFDVSGQGNNTLATSHPGGAGNRILIANNLAYPPLGHGLFNAGGQGGATVLAMGTATSNVTMVNNTVVGPLTSAGYYAPFIFDFTGGAVGQVAGLTIKNNILPFGIPNSGPYPEPSAAGIETFSFQATGPGLLSHPATPQPGQSCCAYQEYAPAGVFSYATLLNTAAGYTSSTPGRGIGGVDVINGGSGYPDSGRITVSGCSTTPAGGYSAAGGVIGQVYFSDFGSGCNPTGMTATASGGGSGASFRVHYGLTPAYKWSGNVITCMDFVGADMSAPNCSWFTSTMPSGDSYPAASTIAARLAQAGVSSNYAIAPAANNAGNVGANLNAIYTETGTVTAVKVTVSASSAQVSYLSPDYRACSVDTSLDGFTWMRTTDSGGLRQRSLTINGLNAGTAYDYRLLCYTEQLSPLFAGDQITDGTFSTLRAGTGSPSFPFALSAVSGATGFEVTMTAIGGARYANTCTVSPCRVSNVPVGDYTTVQQWLAGSTVLASSDPQVVSVR